MNVGRVSTARSIPLRADGAHSCSARVRAVALDCAHTRPVSIGNVTMEISPSRRQIRRMRVRDRCAL